MRDEAAAASRSWFRRIGWLVLFWAGGVLALGVVALAFRLLMAAAGLTG